MKKSGFTLAEVLITLGIIGVVAALTTPALVSSSRNEANGAKLAVSVSSLENAFSSAIVSEGVDNLYGTKMWSNETTEGQKGIFGDSSSEMRQRFVGELGRYLKVKGTVRGDNPVKAIYNEGGIHPMGSTGGTNKSKEYFENIPGEGKMFPIYLNNGAIALIRIYKRDNPTQALIDQRVAAGTGYYTNAADVLIDVNGKKGPNTFGRDVFTLQLGENGVLYPCGGLDVAIVDLANPDKIWSKSGHPMSCTDSDKGSDPGILGFGCTARLLEENYKMNY